MHLVLDVTSFQKALMGTGSRHVFDETGGLIGRGRRSDWVLPDPDRFVSGTHAEISFDGDRFYITDVSTNGIFLNDSSVPLGRGARWPISSGDRMALGDFEIVARIDDESDVSQLAARSSRAFDLPTTTRTPPVVPTTVDIDSLIGPAPEEGPIPDLNTDSVDARGNRSVQPTLDATAQDRRDPNDALPPVAMSLPDDRGPETAPATAPPPQPAAESVPPQIWTKSSSPSEDPPAQTASTRSPNFKPSLPPGIEDPVVVDEVRAPKYVPAPPPITASPPPQAIQYKALPDEASSVDGLIDQDPDDPIAAIAKLDLDDLIDPVTPVAERAFPRPSAVDKTLAEQAQTSTTPKTDVSFDLPDHIDDLLGEPFDAPPVTPDQPAVPAPAPTEPDTESVPALYPENVASKSPHEPLSPQSIEAGLALPDHLTEL